MYLNLKDQTSKDLILSLPNFDADKFFSITGIDVLEKNKGLANEGCGNNGNCNIGCFNEGNHNFGSFNIGNSHKGFFNVETTDSEAWKKAMMFDKPVEITVNEFMETNIHGLINKLMSLKERQFVWDSFIPADKELILSLPHFDSVKFLKITGIDVRV